MQLQSANGILTGNIWTLKYDNLCIFNGVQGTCMCMTCLKSDFFKNGKLQIGKKIDGSLVVHSKNLISPYVLVPPMF